MADSAATKDALYELGLTVKGLDKQLESLNREIQHRPTMARVAVVCGGTALGLLTPATILITTLFVLVVNNNC